VFEAHGRLYHSTPGLREIKKKKEKHDGAQGPALALRGGREAPAPLRAEGGCFL